MPFAFYHIETTGSHSQFDQIIGFSAIFTDSDLNELERFTIHSRLLPNVVPDPSVILQAGLQISDLLTREHSHYQMMTALRAKLLALPGSMFVGFDSIDNAEHFVRQAFYKTLHPVYLTNTNNNCRADAAKILRAVSVFSPEALVFPKDGQGNFILTLEEVAVANGFNTDTTSHAFAHLEAMLFLCRLIGENAPHIWSASLRFSQKAAVASFIEEEESFFLSEYFFKKNYCWPVTFLGHSSVLPGEAYLFNFQVDPATLLNLNEQQLAQRLDMQPKPVRRLRMNSCPNLAPLDEDVLARVAWGLSLDDIEKRLEIIRGEEGFVQRLVSSMEAIHGKEKAKSPHVEGQIYDGFPSKEDNARMQHFHAATWEQRAQIVESFSDTRLKELASRLIYFERPDVLGEVARLTQYENTKARLLGLGESTSCRTLDNALVQIQVLMNSTQETDAALLEAYRNHLLQTRNFYL